MATAWDNERMSDPTWIVGTDRDDELTARFDSETAAINFAEIDSQLEGKTAVVTRHDPDGKATVIATFVMLAP